MVSLRRLFGSLGYSGVATLIASGNVVFEAAARSPAALERKIGEALRKALGYEVGVFIRTPAELAAIVNHEPFQPSEFGRGAQLHVVFLPTALDAKTRRVVEWYV